MTDFMGIVAAILICFGSTITLVIAATFYILAAIRESKPDNELRDRWNTKSREPEPHD